MSEDFNPYAPGRPENQTATPLSAGDFPLATLWDRFAANFVDAILLILLSMVPYFAMIIAYGVFVDPSYLDATIARDSKEYLMESGFMLVSMSGAFLLLNAYLIAKRGQTIGKYLLKTQMVGDDGHLVSWERIFLNRYALFWVLSCIPIIQIIGFIDPLAVFGAERKCLHDRVARTKVISLR